MRRISMFVILLTLGIVFFTVTGFGKQDQEKSTNKDKTLEAEKLYEQGAKYTEEAKYEDEIVTFNKVSPNFREIGNKEGEAN